MSMSTGRQVLKLFTGEPDRPPENVGISSNKVVALTFFDARNSKGILEAARRISEIRNAQLRIYLVLVCANVEDFR
jgi:hypothetical protein